MIGGPLPRSSRIFGLTRRRLLVVVAIIVVVAVGCLSLLFGPHLILDGFVPFGTGTMERVFGRVRGILGVQQCRPSNPFGGGCRH